MSRFQVLKLGFRGLGLKLSVSRLRASGLEVQFWVRAILGYWANIASELRRSTIDRLWSQLVCHVEQPPPAVEQQPEHHTNITHDRPCKEFAEVSRNVGRPAEEGSRTVS